MDKQKLIFKDMLSVEKFSFLLQTFTTLFYVHKKGKIRLGAWYYSSVWIQNLWLNCHTCAVVGMQLHALQSNLRVLQIIVFRVRLSCPWRKTDHQFRDQVKFSNCIQSYVITAAKTVHFCYWQPKRPSHPVFLSGCFVVLFSKMKSVSSAKTKLFP